MNKFDVAGTNTAICKALGLDPETTVGLKIELQPGSVPKVTVTSFICNAEDKHVGFLEHYHLVPNEDAP